MDEHIIRFSFLSGELHFLLLLVLCFSLACFDSCASCRLSGSLEERWIYHFARGSGKLCSGVVVYKVFSPLLVWVVVLLVGWTRDGYRVWEGIITLDGKEYQIQNGAE